MKNLDIINNNTSHRRKFFDYFFVIEYKMSVATCETTQQTQQTQQTKSYTDQICELSESIKNKLNEGNSNDIKTEDEFFLHLLKAINVFVSSKEYSEYNEKPNGDTMLKMKVNGFDRVLAVFTKGNKYNFDFERIEKRVSDALRIKFQFDINITCNFWDAVIGMDQLKKPASRLERFATEMTKASMFTIECDRLKNMRFVLWQNECEFFRDKLHTLFVFQLNSLNILC